MVTKNNDQEYRNYVSEHIKNVGKFWEQLKPIMVAKNILGNYQVEAISGRIQKHDASKYSEAEFDAYRQRFYPYPGETPDQEKFAIAWRHHYETNDHHWEFWLRYDERDKTTIALPMSFPAVIEMLCDWGAMSTKFKNIPSGWYSENKCNMLLHKDVLLLIDDCMHLLDVCYSLVK